MTMVEEMKEKVLVTMMISQHEAPRKCKRAGKQKTKKAKVDGSWTDQIKDVTIEHMFTPKPTVTHTLPPTATPMDFFCT